MAFLRSKSVVTSVPLLAAVGGCLLASACTAEEPTPLTAPTSDWPSSSSVIVTPDLGSEAKIMPPDSVDDATASTSNDVAAATQPPQADAYGIQLLMDNTLSGTIALGPGFPIPPDCTRPSVPATLGVATQVETGSEVPIGLWCFGPRDARAVPTETDRPSERRRLAASIKLTVHGPSGATRVIPVRFDATFSGLAVWLTWPGTPTGRHQVVAESPWHSATAFVDVVPATSPRLLVSPPGPVAPGTHMWLGLAGFPAGRTVAVPVFVTTNALTRHVRTLPSIVVDSTGEATIDISSRPSDPAGRYIVWAAHSDTAAALSAEFDVRRGGMSLLESPSDAIDSAGVALPETSATSPPEATGTATPRPSATAQRGLSGGIQDPRTDTAPFMAPDGGARVAPEGIESLLDSGGAGGYHGGPGPCYATDRATEPTLSAPASIEIGTSAIVCLGGFAPNAQVDLVVTRPDGVVVPDSLTTNGSGGAAWHWVRLPNDVRGVYHLLALQGERTAAGRFVVVSATEPHVALKASVVSRDVGLTVGLAGLPSFTPVPMVLYRHRSQGGAEFVAIVGDMTPDATGEALERFALPAGIGPGGYRLYAGPPKNKQGEGLWIDFSVVP